MSTRSKNIWITIPETCIDEECREVIQILSIFPQAVPWRFGESRTVFLGTPLDLLGKYVHVGRAGLLIRCSFPGRSARMISSGTSIGFQFQAWPTK